MRTLRFHEHGPALDVLRLEEAEPPVPGPGQIRIAVQACGLNPADWALCEGLFAGELPRGIGLEVSGTVDAIGEGVAGVAIGDPVLGPAPFLGPTAGAAEQALLDVWFPRPAGLDPVAAAALPMAVETACRGLRALGVCDGAEGKTVLVHGAGTTVGYAAVQIAIEHGARVLATAGETYAKELRALGAEVTGYGEGMAERVTALAGGPVDLAFDAAPVSGALPVLLQTVRSPRDVLTVSDFGSAKELGARFSGPGGEGTISNDVLGHYARLAAEGRFSVPVARSLPLAGWREGVEASLSGRARGKLVLRIG
jgi:NADPH:quinone reductase-like Zn-dependent oxidoreductase